VEISVEMAEAVAGDNQHLGRFVLVLVLGGQTLVQE
jgi:hypothetical protein